MLEEDQEARQEIVEIQEEEDGGDRQEEPVEILEEEDGDARHVETVETLEDGNVIYWRPKHLLAQRQHPEA